MSTKSENVAAVYRLANERDEYRRRAAALALALTRLVTVCEGAGWLRRPGDAIEQARKALQG